MRHRVKAFTACIATLLHPLCLLALVSESLNPALNGGVRLIDQNFYVVPAFTLESGRKLHQVPVTYKTQGVPMYVPLIPDASSSISSRLTT